MKSASDTKFEDQRQRDLKDAYRVLTQAVTTGGQEKNPAAWYYLARYYGFQKDLEGADSAFAKAQDLAPKCKDDIELWRRSLWVPVFNSGIQAWQAGNTDSAIASFRRADQIYTSEPTGFTYLATLLSGAGQPDSAVKYFKLGVRHAGDPRVAKEKRDGLFNVARVYDAADRLDDAAAAYQVELAGAGQPDSAVKYFKLAVRHAEDPRFAKEKRDALFNVARVYHAADRLDDAATAYKVYLAAYPNDVQAMAGLAAAYMRQGRKDSAAGLLPPATTA